MAQHSLMLLTLDNGLMQINYRLTGLTGQFNDMCNMLDGAPTPYVQAGVDWTCLDSNVTDGPSSMG